MKAGDELRIRGEGGNETTVVVGEVFDERTIQGRLDSGDWELVEKPKARQSRKAAASDEK